MFPNDLFNRGAIATSVVCLITSNLSRAKAPGNVLLRKGEANLAKASVVNISQILSVDRRSLRIISARLTGASVRAVRDRLHLLFDRLQPSSY